MNILIDDIKKLIKKLALPAMIGTLFQTLYNIVDTFFAGKISAEALSALSKSFPVYFIIIATSIGVTVAGTSLIGNIIGEKNEKNSLFYFSHIIYFGILISIIITFIGLNFSVDIFKLMGSSEYVTNLGLQYTNIIFSGSILFILVVAINSLLHAEGDTKTYRNVLILSFLINIILNPILIFGFLFIPALGMKGIGISTLIAQSVALIIVLFKVLRNERIKKLTKEFLVPKLYYFKNIFFQSMPIIVSICGYSIAAGIIFTYVGLSGEYATAGYGVGTRVEQVVLLPILGINTAIITIIAQNFGARNFERVKEAYFGAIKYALIIMLFCSVTVFIFSNHITSVFSNDPTVIEYGGKYLQISAFVLTAYPIFFLSNGFFMALKKSEYAMISNFFRNVLNPVIVFYFAKLYDASFDQFFWIWVIINWLFSTGYFLFTFNYMRSKLNKSGAVVNPQP
jgi:putative MATE family efflux protein